ncbi:unnamed protein product [Ectocarpus sp. 8 AP-2014]
MPPSAAIAALSLSLRVDRPMSLKRQFASVLSDLAPSLFISIKHAPVFIYRHPLRTCLLWANTPVFMYLLHPCWNASALGLRSGGLCAILCVRHTPCGYGKASTPYRLLPCILVVFCGQYNENVPTRNVSVSVNHEKNRLRSTGLVTALFSVPA